MIRFCELSLTGLATAERVVRRAEGAWVVKSLLARMERWLATHRPDYLACLQRGVRDTQLDKFEARFGVNLPAAFRELYRWRNGQEDGCYDSLQLNRMFTPLDEVADIKDMLDGMIGTDFKREGWWRRGWVPFLSNGGGSHLCLDLTAEDGGKVGQLVAFWKADADRPVEYPSVKAWLEELVASMEDGSLELV